MVGLAAWHIWVILALILAGLELLGAQFVLLALGVSALGGALAAGPGAGPHPQVISGAVPGPGLGAPVCPWTTRPIGRAARRVHWIDTSGVVFVNPV